MAISKYVLDRQAEARVFPFGTALVGGESLVTLNKGTAALSTVLLDIKASASIAGDLNLIGNLNITGNVNTTSTTNTNIADITLTLNDGGSSATAVGGGINIEGDTNTVIGAIRFISTGSRFTIGNGTTQSEIVDLSTAQTLTNKSISGGQITSAVANATLAATVTTNANLTGVITSVGNTTSIGAQTGTGSTFVVQTSPSLITPVLGVATGTSLSVTSGLSTGTSGPTGVDGLLSWRNAANAFTQAFRGSAVAASITYVLPTTDPTAGQVLAATTPSVGVSTLSWASVGTGSVTSVSVVTANGISGTVATATSTPAITLVLGAITPTTVNGNTFTTGTGTLTLGLNTLSVNANSSISGTFTGSSSGANTGDQTTITGNAGSATLTNITDDTITNGTQLLTWVGAASGNQVVKVSSTKLTFNPSTGTLSSTIFSGAGTGLTGTASSLTAGTVTTNANLTGMVTSVGNATTIVTNANLTGDVTSVGNATTLARYFRTAIVSGTQDATNKVFTIGTAVMAGSEQVFLNGQLLTSGGTNDYLISGITITFQAAFSAPTSTDVIRVYGVF